MSQRASQRPKSRSHVELCRVRCVFFRQRLVESLVCLFRLVCFFRVLFVSSESSGALYLFFLSLPFFLALSPPSTLALPRSCRGYYHVSFVMVTVSHTLFLSSPLNTVPPPSFHTHHCKFRVKLQCSKKAGERKNNCISSMRVKSLATDSGYLGVA